jgi:3-amino-5-hydroxybenzoic acid synthesis related protein
VKYLHKGIVFDFDGVIIDSLDIQKKALAESYKIIVGDGMPPISEFIKHSGDSLRNIFFKMNLPLEMIEPFKRISQKNDGLIKVYPGIKTLLRRLRENGFRCGLCTGKDSLRTLQLLQKLHLNHYFQTVVCSDNVENPKPYADSLILAAGNLGVRLEDIVMIGDSCNDIDCAKNAGVRSIAVTWGNMGKDVLVKQSPDNIVSSVEELYDSIISILKEEKSNDITIRFKHNAV